MAIKKIEECEIEMTPMIDVVFQLIIFFIVTLTIDQTKNEEIRLEPAIHGPVIEDQENKTTMIIEVNRRGWISMHGAQLRPRQLKNLIKSRYKRHGQYPILIRGDRNTRHGDIKSVMDICTECGIWRISFAAIKEKKT